MKYEIVNDQGVYTLAQKDTRTIRKFLLEYGTRDVTVTFDHGQLSFWAGATQLTIHEEREED